MKKYTKIAYIALILIVLLSGFFIYKVSGKNKSNERLEEKTLAEVKHLENEFQNLFNQFNNISFENYKISSTEIKKEEDENKEESLKELSILYDYLPQFVENCTEDEKEKTVIKTKNYIFKAYSVLDKEEWDTISDYINSATQEFTKIITNLDNKENGNQYNINKVYVMTNELQNAVTLKDKEVFLIKYKNLLEELENV